MSKRKTGGPSTALTAIEAEQSAATQKYINVLAKKAEVEEQLKSLDDEIIKLRGALAALAISAKAVAGAEKTED